MEIPQLKNLHWINSENIESGFVAITRTRDSIGDFNVADGVSWERLVSLTDLLLSQTVSGNVSARRTMVLGPYSEFYQRSLLLFGTDINGDDEILWIAGLSEKAGLNGDGPVLLPESDDVTKLRKTQSEQLACQVTQAHRESLGDFSDKFEFNPKLLPELVVSPDNSRTRYGLAHDPVAAMFEEVGGC